MADDTTPAFPMTGNEIATGLTMRDYFAAEAMKSMAWIPQNIDICAKSCYDVADAMMRAREGV